ncbi:MAG TPA: SDR family oxidoreductase [Kofleriaceae bacterium]|jgi:NAD(P)-dependent dehydrogenase (short-subunit alcohol dehydrogenase family)|nr:SDR family oxidoreductase [Kofleriaceae bacterium]
MNVVVTGANRGIGLELVRQLIARGDQVDAACRRPDDARELRATGARLHAVDVADGASVAAFAEALGDQPIDLVINNAGVFGDLRQRLADFNYEAAAHAFEVNALGALRVSQALLPNLRRGTGKKLAHISSALGSISGITAPDHLAYRISKAALNMISRSIAFELRDEHIVSIVVHPGWVRTAMGGPDAPTTPAEAATAILAQIDAATVTDTGEFLDTRGARCAW